MRKVYFSVGPSQPYPTLKQHIKNAISKDVLSLSHRGEQFIELVQDTFHKLRQLLKIPEDYRVYFQGSACEAMERIIQNTVESDSIHFVNGSFSEKFYNIAKMLGKNAQKIQIERGSGFIKNDYQRLTKSELIAFTHNETSTGVALGVEDILSIKQKLNTLIALDIVSSVPYVKLDFSKLDLVFFSVQKGFGLPAGLGLLIVSPQAFAKSKELLTKGCQIGSFHSFPVMEEYMQKSQTFETPNVFYIYLLNKICEDMLAKGIKNIRKENEQKSKIMYAYFDNQSKFKPFVNDKEFRSNTILTIKTNNHTKKIISGLAEKGFIVSNGLASEKDKIIRIANFYSHSHRNVKKLLKAFQELE